MKRIQRPDGQVWVGGREQSVAWFDCTQRFDVRRLATLLRGHLSRMISDAGGESVEMLVEECLNRLIVFRPTSTLQLAATIRHLPEHFKASGLGEEIGYVLIDGMSEFGWADQYAAEDRAKSKPSVNPPPSLHLLLSAISYLRTTLAPVTFISQWVFHLTTISSYSTQRRPFWKPHLPLPWPSITKSAPPLDPTDPLKAPLLSNSDTPTFVFQYHITTHAPPAKMIQRGTTMQKALEGRKLGRGGGTEGFMCILRRAGGTEVGAWTWDNLANSVIA